jgi:Flp pilus assembly protein CpaB
VSSRRTAILIGAIAVGVVAVLLIVKYVNGIQEDVNADSALVSVFAASENIARGSDGGQMYNEKKIQERSIPQKFRPATAIQSPDAIQKKVALFNISPGTIIVEGMFVDPTTVQISFRERLKNKQHVAISIKVDQVRGVGGFLVPGDEVNMMVYQDNSKTKDALDNPGAENNPKYLPDLGNIKPETSEAIIRVGGPQWIIIPKTARYMYQKVQILAVGSSQLLGPGEQATSGSSSGSGGTSSGQPAGANDTGLITFDVPPQAAQWIATGNELGFYLSLVAKGYEPLPLPPLPIITDALPGEEQGKLTPYAGEAG